MRKLRFILITILLPIILLSSFPLKTNAFISEIMKQHYAEKYFGELQSLTDTTRNMRYYVPTNFEQPVNVNYCAGFSKPKEDLANRPSVLYSNNTLFSQKDLKDRPYEACFVPGDTLNKWTNKLTLSMSSFYGEDFNYRFVEKKSHMHIIKYSFGKDDDNPVYTFYKISKGVPISMSISDFDFTKGQSDIITGAEFLFDRFSSINSYASKPNIGFYRVCVGSFKVQSNAYNLAIQAKSKGFGVNITTENNFYRVNIGAFRIKENAESFQKSAISKGFKDTFLYYHINK